MSATGEALWKALDNAKDWEVTEYHITHKPSKQCFWIANGPFFFNGYAGTPPCIGLIERHWLYWKARSVPDALVARLLTEGAA